MMDELQIFNSFEAVFWVSVGTIVYFKSRGNPYHSRLGAIAACRFVLFGISDVFEVFTGAWWRPWTLFALKATCVAMLLICGAIYRLRLRQH